MMLVCACLAALAALGLYLACAHQGVWPAARAHARTLRAAAGLCMALSVAAGVVALGTWPGLFAALAAWMMTLVLLPYLDAWRRLRRKPCHVG